MAVTVVSISGASGSGKSSLVIAIVNRLPNAVALHFDDYKETTQFPADLALWVRDGCNPNEFVTPKMVEDLHVLRSQQNDTQSWIIVEEPFGRGRNAMTGLFDFVVCIDIPLEIAFARTVKRSALAAPDDIEASFLLKSIIAYVDQYLSIGRDTYICVNNYVMRDCELIVDGSKEVDALADEIITLLQK